MRKTIIFSLMIVANVYGNAQSLKDLLYGGKLKNDSNSVVRKTDDLSTKIDTTTKKPEPPKTKASEATHTSATAKQNSQGDSLMATGDVKDSIASVATTDNNVATKNNNQIWKTYMDSLAAALKTEVLPSKKLK